MSRLAATALRAVAALRFDLVTEHGELTPATFVNVVESSDAGLVVLARFAHAHALVGARRPPVVREDPEHQRPDVGERNV